MPRIAPLLIAVFGLVMLGMPMPRVMSCDEGKERNRSEKVPCPESEVAHYTAYRTKEAIKVDGRLEEASWKQVPRSPRFVDLVSGKRALYDTRAAVLWDDENLYVGFWLEEPDVQGDITERDSPISRNNDAEVFIAGKDGYYEFEINSLGTIMEQLLIWKDAYETGDYADISELRPDDPRFHYHNGGGDYNTHPRGLRAATYSWDYPGLKSAVFIDGTLNNSKDRDRGWTVEVAFPWKGLEVIARADQRSLPPLDGDTWQIDFSRFNQYKEAPPAEDSSGWVWSTHRIWDSHIPECFPYIHFSTRDVSVVVKKE